MNVAGRPRAVSASTWSFISEMSGEIDDREPGQHQRRHLEAERLSAARRQDHERVAPLRARRLHRALLSGTEVRVAESRAQDLARASSMREGRGHRRILRATTAQMRSSIGRAANRQTARAKCPRVNDEPTSSRTPCRGGGAPSGECVDAPRDTARVISATGSPGTLKSMR